MVNEKAWFEISGCKSISIAVLVHFCPFLEALTPLLLYRANVVRMTGNFQSTYSYLSYDRYVRNVIIEEFLHC